MSNQRIDILKLLLTRDPNIVRELDLIDLYRDMLFSVRVFRNSVRSAFAQTCGVKERSMNGLVEGGR